MKSNFDFEAQIAEMQKMLDKFKELNTDNNRDLDKQISELELKIQEKRKELYAHLSPWQTVQIARHQKRPVLQDYIQHIFTDFVELHGDRVFSDDRAIIGGFAKIDDQKVMIIGHNKGKNLNENIERNFGQGLPDGYRKAMRLMHLAEKFNIPILTFIDTQGAFPGIEGEERGQHEAIARNLLEMSRVAVPIISVITGEGGSGGALGIAVGDIICMLSHGIYSVISPEGCASILFRDSTMNKEAAEVLKLTAPDLLGFGIIDEIIKEPVGGAHTDPTAVALAMKESILRHLKSLRGLAPNKLVDRRFEKFSKMGKFNKV